MTLTIEDIFNYDCRFSLTLRRLKCNIQTFVPIFILEMLREKYKRLSRERKRETRF